MKFLKKPVIVKKNDGSVAGSDIRNKKGLPPKTSKTSVSTSESGDPKKI